MKLSTRSRYGSRILLELARHYQKGPVRAGRIADNQGLPVKYLEQLIRTLKKADLVSSVRGAQGGHMLARNPSEITLGQIVRLFEDQADLVECINSPEKCDMSDECRVRLAWGEATAALYKKIDTITIADLLSDSGPYKIVC